jgi:hypothetical protein
VVTLQSSELAANAIHPWTARLRYAYADALLAVGRETEAREWFAKAVEADHNGTTDASDRLAQLDGVAFVDAFEGDEEEDHGNAVHDDAAADADAGSAAPAGADVVVEVIDDGLTDEVLVDDDDDDNDDTDTDTDTDEDDGDDDEEDAERSDASDGEDDAASDADRDDAGARSEASGADTDADALDAAKVTEGAKDTEDTKDTKDAGTDEQVSDDAESSVPSSFLDSPFRAPAHPEREDD